MAGSLPNNISQERGNIAAARPIASVIAKTIAAPTQAALRARSRLPAPMQVPTMASSGAPKPNARGTNRYSRRAAVPYPAIASGPNCPDSAVAIPIDRLAATVAMAPTRPIRRMSRNSGQRRRTPISFDLSRLRGERRYIQSASVPPR
ncbi:hypothetical protein D3C84_673010 [compost metagenome]